MNRISKTIVLTVTVALAALLSPRLNAHETMILTPRQQTLSVVAALEAKGDIEGLRNALNEGFDNGLTVSEANTKLRIASTATRTSNFQVERKNGFIAVFGNVSRKGDFSILENPPSLSCKIPS